MTSATATGYRKSTPPSLGLVPSERANKLSDPKYQAYLILRAAFVTAPILFGVDKFFNWMTYWPKYLWAGFPHLLGVSELAMERIFRSMATDMVAVLNHQRPKFCVNPEVLE